MDVISPVLSAALSVLIGTSESNLQVKPGDYVAKQSIGIAMQYPDYPAGCEPMSLCILLKAYSYEVTIPEIMSYFNVTDNDFLYGYYGSIYSEGAAYPPAVVMAANRYLNEQRSRLTAVNISLSSWDTIESYIREGKPLMVWTTIDFTDPDMLDWNIDGHHMYSNEHCVVLYDVDADSVYISDPIEGLIERPKQDFERIWKLCGSMAVMVDIFKEC